MKERINDKIEEIEGFLNELLEILPLNIKNYIQDFKTKAACERYFEKIIEAIVDLAFLIIKLKKFEIPEGDKETFDILAKNNIIPPVLAEKFKEAKGMRNILAHKYGDVDNELVFHAITEEMERDAKEFIKTVKKELK